VQNNLVVSEKKIFLMFFAKFSIFSNTAMFEADLTNQP